MDLFLGIMILVLGLCAGSFVNMLLYRTAIRYKLVKSLKSKSLENEKRSFCDFCGKQLRWYENVPVVSWVMLRGKTLCCNKKLPIQYPLVELGTGILFLIYNLRFMKYEWGEVIGLVVITLLVFEAVFDLKHMVLPDFSTVILVGLALIMNYQSLPMNLASALGAAGFLLILNLATKGKGMGMGDVKYAVFMGMLLGWQKTILAFYIAFVSGAIIGMVMLLLKKAKKGSQIAFGPFLILGTLVAWWWGERLMVVFGLK